MSQALAAQPEGKLTFAEDLQRNKTQIAAVLPAHITPEKFVRTVLTAVTQTPDLLQVDRRTLFNACVKCAADGLIPDGREAALVVFNVKDKATGGWKKSAQYMPMVRGLIKLARQSGEIATISANIVREGDEFEYVLGDDERLIHRPNLESHGKARLVYATVTFKDGSRQREVLTMADVAKAREVSKSKDSGPWKDWFDEMAKKTAIRRLLKYVNLSPDAQRAIESDDDTDFIAQKRAALADVPADAHRTALAALAAPEDDAISEADTTLDARAFNWQAWAEETQADLTKYSDADKLDADWSAVKERMMNDDAPEEIRAALTTAYLEQKQSLGGRKR